jgi:transcription termination/antitermination protein NusG
MNQEDTNKNDSESNKDLTEPGQISPDAADQNDGESEAHWYVLHTYSGYEDNVARNLRQRIESMGMEDKIIDVVVPREKKIKVKHGKRKTIEERLFPGYVLIKMIVTEDSWYVVRNTPNVTGFVGSGTTPTPVSQEEIGHLLKRMGEDEPKYKMDVSEGDSVKIVDGPFKDFEGRISEVNEAKGTVKVLVNVFGRETPVELDFLQVNKEA